MTSGPPQFRSSSNLAPPYQDDSESSFSSPVHLSQPPTRQTSPNTWDSRPSGTGLEEQEETEDNDFEAWDDLDDMPSDLRPSSHRPVESKSSQPLLSNDKPNTDYASPHRPAMQTRRSTFRERDPDVEAAKATKRRYTIAGGFLILSLISFTIQTETAVYIQHTLKWNKAYCMLWVHSRRRCVRNRRTNHVQIPHSRLLVVTMAHAASHYTSAKVQDALAALLEATCPDSTDDSADGRT